MMQRLWEWGGVERERERGYRNMARKMRRRERLRLSLGSNQGPLMVMRDGVQRKGLMYPWVYYMVS